METTPTLIELRLARTAQGNKTHLRLPNTRTALCGVRVVATIARPRNRDLTPSCKVCRGLGPKVKRDLGEPEPTSCLPWSVPGLGARVMEAVESVHTDPSPARIVAAIMALLNEVGYDSYDREVAFKVACAIYGGGGIEPALVYEDLYQAWLNV